MQSQLIAGRYHVLRAIGRGGMGTVWLCRDEVLGREVAVKQIGALPGESTSETKRAMREARSAAALNHPNAVAVYDVVDHGGRPWLVMEYVEGQTLADEIARDGKLPPQRVADIGAQLAGALARAHERRIVHRDIKPGNVLMDKSGRPKISDFGIARGHGDEQLTQIGFITGTPGYLSPELARGGDPHPASDVWALGATLYEAVEGQSPYETRSNPIAMLRAIATERPRPLTNAGNLGSAIEAMMHEDPSSRWDMATSARRLGGIARITSVMPRVSPAPTAVIATPPVEPTQRLQDPPPPTSTTPLAGTPVAGTPAAGTPAAGTPAAGTPVVGQSVVGQSMAGQSMAETVSTEAAPSPMGRSARRDARDGIGGAGSSGGAGSDGGSRGNRGNGGSAVPSHRSGRRRWVALALLAMLVAAVGVAYAVSPLGDQPGTLASGTPGRSTPTSASTTSDPPTTPPSPSSVATAPTVAPSSSAPSATGTPSSNTSAATTSSAPGPDPNDDKELENFVTSYYSNVTKDTSRTWAQLTPRMQAAANGRSGYDRFWKSISRVRVNQTKVDASAKTAVVNLTYIRGDGNSSTETHTYRFTTGAGGYLIDGERMSG